ncbi:hypothetical protein M758_2G106100 [Ceratodon purpureus]|nr:hypothetical protein M758_2G106100 [Ceratodon purpureus]
MVLISRMEAYQQDSCGLMMKTEPLSNPMGFRSWTDLPRGFEDLKEREHAGAYGGNMLGQRYDMRCMPNFGFALPVPPSSGIRNQSSGDLSVQSGSPGASYSSGTSYDCNSTGNVDSIDESSLSYLMDGNVRAMLKKVAVNEGALNQTIQSLGGGEKGLKELIGYIMLWVKKQKGENCDDFFSSQNLSNLRPQQQVNPAFGYASNMANSSSTFNLTMGRGPYDQRNDRTNRTFKTVQSSDEALDLNQFYHRAKSRRLMDDGEVDSSSRSDIHSGNGTFVDVRGSIPDEFRYPKLEMGTGSPNSVGQVTLARMPRELDIQQPVPCLQPSLSFSSGQDSLSQTLAATTRAARRNRIARQRQSMQQSHERTPSNGTAVSGCGLWSIAPPTLDLRSAGMFHPGIQLPTGVPASSGRKACNVDMMTFLLQKELRPSDVGNLGRIILPKKEAEQHLPILALREGVTLQMEDFDSGQCWNIRYRFWPNNKSRMYLLENTGDFVKSHHLEEGDLLILYRNQQGNYVLRGKKKAQPERRGAQGLKEETAHSLARGFPEAPLNTVEVLKERDYGVGFEDRSDLKVKAEPTVLVGDDDLFFKDDLMHNIDSSFGAGLIQPLERFPSLNLDFPLDEIMAGIPKDDNDTEDETQLVSKLAVVAKTEPAG